jgi:hypothetical protein
MPPPKSNQAPALLEINQQKEVKNKWQAIQPPILVWASRGAKDTSPTEPFGAPSAIVLLAINVHKSLFPHSMNTQSCKSCKASVPTHSVAGNLFAHVHFLGAD